MSNVALMRGLYEAFGRGDVPTVLGGMHPQIKWHEAEGHPYMPSGEAFIGPNEVLNKVFMRLGSDFDAFQVHANRFYDAGNVIVVEARYTGTHKGTGRSLDAQVCHVWTIEGGKVAKFQQYVDTAQLQRVMGTSLE